MKLRERFNRLTFLNKLGTIGFVCSIGALLIALPTIAEFYSPKNSYEVEILENKIYYKRDSRIAKEIDFSNKAIKVQNQLSSGYL